MNEEEKKAIERLEEQLNFWKKQNIKNSDCEIILNLITKLQKENEEKDKQIDLMADLIYEISKVFPGTVFYALTSNGFDLSKCDGRCQEKLETCKDCIKQYFERKVEDECKR